MIGGLNAYEQEDGEKQVLLDLKQSLVAPGQ